MAIGTLTAIGLAAGVGGSLLSSHSQNKAASKAADTSLQVSQQNNALAQQIYGQNQQALSPFMQRGNAAGDTLNAFLGLGSPAAPPAAQGFNPAAYAAYSGQNPMMSGDYLGDGPGMPFPARFRGFGSPGFNMEGTPTAPAQAAAPTNPGDPFRQYIQNSDYGFQFGEGSNRVNSGYAGNGTLRSGAAMKDLERFRQNLQAGYRGEYTNLLANQQGVGLSGASALAGVGQNYVGTVSANNQNAGDAAANAALMRGANNPFANSLSLLGGGLFGYGR